MPATGEPGWHFVDLYPGIYKGQETRPNNFRIPQLTYAADHPGEDDRAYQLEARGRIDVTRRTNIEVLTSYELGQEMRGSINAASALGDSVTPDFAEAAKPTQSGLYWLYNQHIPGLRDIGNG